MSLPTHDMGGATEVYDRVTHLAAQIERDERTGSAAVTPVHELMTRLLLTRDETARVLSIKPETLDYLHRMKRLRAVKVGKELRWRPPDVQRFVDELEVGEGG